MGNPVPKQLTEKDVEFEFTAEPEDHAPDWDDAEAIAWINDQLERGNDAAWFCAKVTARWGEFEGVDYLGGCSYRSFAEFEEDPYFEDLKARALEDLNREIAAKVQKLSGLL